MIDVDRFFNAIEIIVGDCQCSYIDAIVSYCEKNEIEVEIAALLVRANPTMKKKVFRDSSKLNLVD